MKTTLMIALAATILSFNAQAGEKVIYGQDNRHDLYDVTNPVYTKVADSTVALMERGTLTSTNDASTMDISASSFQDLMGVCSSERFSDQPSGAFCSGSLIGKNLILTAGHCITSADSCANTQFVFNYGVYQKGAYPTTAKSENVYNCKEIVYRIQDSYGADFAIVKTDRDVTNHEPLKLAQRTGKIAVGTELGMSGCPSGLPFKIDDGADVRSNDDNGFFVATTDSYGGNSGSPVFNRKTGELEGVLVRGEQDFVYKNGCYVSNVVSQTGGRGEDVTDISYVAKQLPSLR